jgi:L-rhamnose isomerase
VQRAVAHVNGEIAAAVAGFAADDQAGLDARLIALEKLAGFHFNDSKYGDDDLDSGSINPFQI